MPCPTSLCDLDTKNFQRPFQKCWKSVNPCFTIEKATVERGNRNSVTVGDEPLEDQDASVREHHIDAALDGAELAGLHLNPPIETAAHAFRLPIPPEHQR